MRCYRPHRAPPNHPGGSVWVRSTCIRSPLTLAGDSTTPRAHRRARTTTPPPWRRARPRSSRSRRSSRTTLVFTNSSFKRGHCSVRKARGLKYTARPLPLPTSLRHPTHFRPRATTSSKCRLRPRAPPLVRVPIGRPHASSLCRSASARVRSTASRRVSAPSRPASAPGKATARPSPRALPSLRRNESCCRIRTCLPRAAVLTFLQRCLACEQAVLCAPLLD